MLTTTRTVTTRVHSVAIIGIEAKPVEVEVDLATQGLPEFRIVGLPSTAVREARQRVRAAIQNSGIQFPNHRITVNLAPGDLRKEGPSFDLSIAVGIVSALENLKGDGLFKNLFVGELALDGRVRPVRGALAAARYAKDRGFQGIVVPSENAAEAAMVDGVGVFGIDHLVEAIAFVGGELLQGSPRSAVDDILDKSLDTGPDLCEVKGQALARRALEIAAAGDHNLLLVGPPGCGKTMLARRLPGILPPFTRDEAIEVTHIWSVAGLLEPGQALVSRRPFRSPHHLASASSVIGGGSPWPKPGEISLAHRGVLFLDELPLFSRAVLEGLRQPLEEGVVTIARSGATLRFPSRVTVVAAANPCFCSREPCICPPSKVDGYRARLSGPLLDRIDLHSEVARLTEEEMFDIEESEPNWIVRSRVSEARRRRLERELSEQTGQADDNLSSLAKNARAFLRRAFNDEVTSARAFSKCLKIARTIGDLEGSEVVEESHLAEALQFRRVVWQP